MLVLLLGPRRGVVGPPRAPLAAATRVEGRARTRQWQVIAESTGGTRQARRPFPASSCRHTTGGVEVAAAPHVQLALGLRQAPPLLSHVPLLLQQLLPLLLVQLGPAGVLVVRRRHPGPVCLQAVQAKHGGDAWEANSTVLCPTRHTTHPATSWASNSKQIIWSLSSLLRHTLYQTEHAVSFVTDVSHAVIFSFRGQAR